MDEDLPTIPYLSAPAGAPSRPASRRFPVIGFLAVIALLVAADLVFLNIIVLFRWFPGGTTAPVVSVIGKPDTSAATCPAACPAVTTPPAAAATPASAYLSPTPKPTAQPTAPAYTGPKEFFVPLGSGSNATDDWADVPGVAATVNPANYDGIRAVTFEASLRIPTGNERAFVRLFNTTAKHPVWFSELSLDGGEPKLLTSAPVTLDPGTNTYQVQMKTSLKFPAYLDQARIRIVIR